MSRSKQRHVPKPGARLIGLPQNELLVVTQLLSAQMIVEDEDEHERFLFYSDHGVTWEEEKE